MQRFQVQYNLKAIPEVQEYLNVAFERARHHGDLQDLYRRRYGLASIVNCGSLLTDSCTVSWLNLNKQLIQAQPLFLPAICGNFSTGRYGLKRRLHRIDLDVADWSLLYRTWCLGFVWIFLAFALILFDTSPLVYLLHSTIPLHRLVFFISVFVYEKEI